MALEITPGERISVDAVARQLGVSQTPIREAMARLESEGLVRKTPLVGYSATPRLSPTELADLYEMRLQLEPFATRKCAALMPQGVVAQLEALCGEMAALAGREGMVAYAEFAQLDMAFHDQIAVSAGNTLVAEALGRLHVHVHLFRLQAQAGVPADAAAEHEHVLRAIRARDGDSAEMAMRQHIERSRQRFS